MKNFRTKVFKQAHELMRATGKAFAYEKADGSLRKAKGTLKDVSNLIKGTGSENYKTVRYFDVEANGFRSFKVENLITIY